MAIASLEISSSNFENPFSTDSSKYMEPLNDFIKAIRRATTGSSKNAYTLTAKSGLVAASGTVTIDSGSGEITATINGVGIAVTWATSDDNTASLLSTAINASSNALVENHVTASVTDNVVTITADSAGIVGNTITLAASGTGATASGARLTGGTTTKVTYSF